MAQGAKDSRIMEMKDTIRQLNTVISSQNELIRSLQDTVQGCNATIANLQEQVDYLTKKLFGTSSEKSEGISGQLSLFNEAEQEAVPEEEPEPTVIREHTRKAKRKQPDTFQGFRRKMLSSPCPMARDAALTAGQRWKS